jgi:sn-glycerol 3-phosphate transport system substrate-binding protein
MKRLVIALAAFALLCGTAFAEPVTIEFWHAMGGKNGDITQAIIDKFNASQSDYKVVGVFKGSYADTMNAGIAAFRAGQPPAILQVYEVGTATMMAAKGAIVPVYKLMKEEGQSFDPHEFIPAIASYYSTSSGQMLSMPFNSSTAVMYYNKDAFQKVGLDPNNPPKTWPEVFADARKLKAAGYQGGLTSNWFGWIQLENFSAWHNVPFGTKSNGFDGFDTRLVFNGPLQLRHLTNLYNLSKEGVFIYGGRDNAANSLFTSGQVPIHFESIGGYGAMQATCKFDFGVAMLPYYPDVKGAPQNSIIGGASLWVMAKQSQAQYKAVAAFLTFLSKPDIQSYFHEQTGYLPVTLAAYKLTKDQGYYKTNPGLEVAIQQLNYKTPTPNSRGIRFGYMPQIRTICDEQWESILGGKETVKQGLDNMVRLGNELLRKFQQIAQ